MQQKTNSLRYWFGKLVCPDCHRQNRMQPETKLVSDIVE